MDTPENESDSSATAITYPTATLNLEDDNGLCERCRSLHLEGDFVEKARLSNNEIKHRSSRCSLRAFLQNITEANEEFYDGGERVYQIERLYTEVDRESVPYYRVSWTRVGCDRGGSKIRLVPKQLMNLPRGEHSTQFARKIQAERTDFELANAWMKNCQTHHTHVCGTDQAEKIRGLRVIDCQTTRILLCESHLPYAALSYTLGETQPGGVEAQPGENMLPRTTPRT
ncbi:hypothetical protein BCR34DRAFT_645389 [Clohesyomyces aquaticus]|uniref:Uncharacterized protein n=1 Tax=Clohesyomyces aquaticus TaxID=1231657 RepID=A0A1Y1Y9T8_9PLEO|nr:hypothetical protein BCR34DRAFT_645389 [Clohesyomyces aquaticus]